MLNKAPQIQNKLPLWIAISAINEAGTIADVVKECIRYTNNVIVLAGNSNDNTPDIAKRHGAKVIMHKGTGKGAAIREAKNFLPDNAVVVFIDADGSHNTEDIPRLIEPICNNTADHVTGSRLLGGSEELHGSFNEFLRLAGSSFITACINWRYKVMLSDTQNGFRALQTDIFKKLNLHSNSTAIEQEMIMQTLKQKFRMAEIPSHEYKRKFGKSKIKLRKVFMKYAYCLIKGLI